jgi:hypothetical protein
MAPAFDSLPALRLIQLFIQAALDGIVLTIVLSFFIRKTGLG